MLRIAEIPIHVNITGIAFNDALKRIVATVPVVFLIIDSCDLPNSIFVHEVALSFSHIDVKAISGTTRL